MIQFLNIKIVHEKGIIRLRVTHYDFFKSFLFDNYSVC